MTSPLRAGRRSRSSASRALGRQRSAALRSDCRSRPPVRSGLTVRSSPIAVRRSSASCAAGCRSSSRIHSVHSIHAYQSATRLKKDSSPIQSGPRRSARTACTQPLRSLAFHRSTPFATPTSSQAASVNESVLLARSLRTLSSSFLTSQSPPLTSPSRARCLTCSPTYARSRVSPTCSSVTTWTLWATSPIVWR